MGYAGAALGAAGSIISTMQQLQENDYQQKMLGNQALQSQYQAQAATEAAQFEENKYRLNAERVLAKSRATVAAGGLDISSGSPLLMELDSTRNAEISALNIRRTGAIQAQGFMFQSGMFKTQQKYVQGQRDWIIAQGVISGLSSIMSGAAGQPTQPTPAGSTGAVGGGVGYGSGGGASVAGGSNYGSQSWGGNYGWF
jgi:hypothetical protein